MKRYSIKILMLTVMISVVLAGCKKAAPDATQTTSVVPTATSPSSTTSPTATPGNATATPKPTVTPVPSSATPTPTSTPVPSSTATPSPSEKSVDYSEYTGTWVTEDNYKANYAFGVKISLTSDKTGNITGEITNTTANATHVATVPFKGKIENNKFVYKFTEDGWENSGTITLEFKDKKILGTITVTPPQGGAGFSIGKGSFTFVKAK